MEPARWLINGRFLSQSPTGVQRYAEEIVRAIDELLTDNAYGNQRLQVELLCPPSSRDLPGLKSIRSSRAGPGKGHFWEQWTLPRYVRDGLLSLGNTGPIAVSKQVICIHDVNTRSFPQSYSKPFRMVYRSLLPVLGRRAAAIATVSDFSATQLSQFGIVPASKITVIPNGHEHIERWKPSHSAITSKASGYGSVVLIGSPAPHKNITLMLRLARRLRTEGLRLAIAGELNPMIFKNSQETNVSKFPCDPAADDGIMWLGRVSDDELSALLRDSLCLAFPSHVEGFGLPALEAMALGCPVIASDRASIPEVCGAAALYAAPDDDEGWLRNILRLRSDPALRQRLVDQGLAQAKKFSWKRSAQIYVRLMTGLDRRPLAGS